MILPTPQQATGGLPPSHARALAALPEPLQQHLRARGAYAPARLLESPLLDLVEALDLPFETIKQIRATVGQRLMPPSSTVAELAAAAASATAPRHVPTGLDTLDNTLNGGIPAGSVTEVVGPAGMGKTQLCMTLTVNSLLGGASSGRAGAWTAAAAADGSDAASPLSGQRPAQPLQSDKGSWLQEAAGQEQQGSVVYIDAEGKMSIKRWARVQSGTPLPPQLASSSCSHSTSTAPSPASAACTTGWRRLRERGFRGPWVWRGCWTGSLSTDRPAAASCWGRSRRGGGQEGLPVPTARAPASQPCTWEQEQERGCIQAALPAPAAPPLLQSLDAVMLPHAVRLVVVDSVAALARLDFAPGSMQNRQRVLGQQASALKRLAETYSVPVLVTNQVMARVREADASESSSNSGGGVAAALGTMWAHAVNTRLVLEAHNGEHVGFR